MPYFFLSTRLACKLATFIPLQPVSVARRFPGGQRIFRDGHSLCYIFVGGILPKVSLPVPTVIRSPKSEVTARRGGLCFSPSPDRISVAAFPMMSLLVPNVIATLLDERWHSGAGFAFNRSLLSFSWRHVASLSLPVPASLDSQSEQSGAGFMFLSSPIHP